MSDATKERVDATQETWSDDFGASPQQLETALRDAWQRARRVDDRTLYRGMTLNLIAVATLDDHDDLDGILERLLVRHPTRAFLVLLDEQCTEPTMRVHVRVREEKSSRQLLLERVVMHAAPHHTGQLRSILLPSRLDDLPTLLYWHGALQHGDVLEELAQIADHIAIDSAAIGCFETAQELAERGDRSLIDLSWFRLRPWRRALAEGFEAFHWQQHLGIEVTIRHSDRPEEACASRILERWLQERLSARVELVAVDAADGPRGEPFELTLCNGDAGSVRVTHDHPEKHLHVEVIARGAKQLPFQVPASRGEPGDLLAAAADRCS